ncbi:hypothetical protein QN277_025506 [Acacia crassicarpa]|uniref:PDZ domain-containing protein n=1 Tax=Acacia crassicarpa TaxID=499986 RepID=A0AAE1MJN7_9FABA|nr:hypothetical protein QN277_025506 [Acacia crassicarpa]
MGHSKRKRGTEVVLARVIDSVVKVFCVHSPPNFSKPWQRMEPYKSSKSSSSGFVISGKRVLTNAHSVEHYTEVKLKKHGSDTKYLATVLAIGTDCDIAMLTVKDDEFWNGMSPVEFGDLPALLDAVTVVGYPIGYETISKTSGVVGYPIGYETIYKTSGVVSCIEMISYFHGSAELLGLQIDTAMNSCNYGGPAFNDSGSCVGIAFQSIDKKNIGNLIPTPVIKHFIHDYEKNRAYTGFPALGIEWQKMRNHELRMAMGMGSDHKGVRIRRIDPTSPAYGVLKPSDVILSFDGVDVANDGTVLFRPRGHINFSYLISQKYIGDTTVIKVLRNSKIYELDITLGSHIKLIPAHIKGGSLSYYIIAGFVFTTVSVPYLCSKYGEDYNIKAPIKLLHKLDSIAESPDEQIVVISQVLGVNMLFGYEDLIDIRVLAFNGKPFKNLKSLASMVENCNDEHLEFSLEDNQIAALQTTRAKDATLNVLDMYRISSAMSDDLKE